MADFDFVAECRAVDVRDNSSLYFCYSLDVGVSLSGDSWVVIEQLDNDFNTLTEVYYSTDSDLMWCCAESITTTRDGGILMTTATKKLADPNKQGSVVVKFPAEAFLGVEEAHTNGLKLAIAYPNPGHDKLNIRTALPDARVEVYDANGRLVHSQGITENVTSINAEAWSEGVMFGRFIRAFRRFDKAQRPQAQRPLLRAGSGLRSDGCCVCHREEERRGDL